ncbi:MAG: type I methionyl aminopeptidase [Gemmatimonadales bacterium]|nr:MAG: type I methionyl aminopeptidase [Gemmatimonadales bacterium]
MIELKSASEIERMAAAGAIIHALFAELEPRVVPGATTLDLDSFAEEFIRSHDGAIPLFKGQYGFPGSLCTSINEEVVHGIPSADRPLVEGDIVSVDVGVRLEGWCGDSARTFGVGNIGAQAELLLDVTRRSLDAAVAAAVPGNHVGDIGAAVEKAARGSGFHIIRDLVGHGIGRELHEDPQIPNRGKPGDGPALREGMVVAIEPMIATGTWRIRTMEDGWTMSTADNSLSAHFEHTVAITARGPRILTGPSAPVTSTLEMGS